MTDKFLQGKVAVVTGGASGIGRAIAERLATAGANVVIGDIQAAPGMAAAQEINGLFIEGDLTRRADCKALVAHTVEEFGGLHILVNNAGIQHIDPLDAFPEDTWDRMLALMLTAPFLLTRYAWPTMKAQAWGRIINVGSIYSTRGTAFKSAYVSAKHGILGLTRTTALEGGPHGVTAHAICPAYVRTPLMEKQIPAQARTHGISEVEVIEKVMLAHTAIKRLIEPSEVADLVAFLCRDEASAMSGSPIMIDLGLSAA